MHIKKPNLLVTSVLITSLLSLIGGAITVAHPEDAPDQKNVNPEEEKPDELDRIVPGKLQGEMGFHKLLPAEREAVASLLSNLVDRGSTSKAAVAHLESEGWEEVQISGKQRAQLDEFDIERQWIVVSSGFSKHAVEVPFGWIEPGGTYWGKMGITGPEEIMDSTGEVHDLTFKKKKRL